MAEAADFLKCAICFETFDNPKQLECYHIYCKECLDALLEFNDDGSAIIKCPLQCQEQTVFTCNSTTNNLRVAYEFKGILEAYNSKDQR